MPQNFSIDFEMSFLQDCQDVCVQWTTEPTRTDVGDSNEAKGGREGAEPLQNLSFAPLSPPRICFLEINSLTFLPFHTVSTTFLIL